MIFYLLLVWGVNMSKIYIDSLKHLYRNEEKDILNYVNGNNMKGHISIFGLSGSGKTETVFISLNNIKQNNLYSACTVLHYDCSSLTEDCSKDLFYNLLIYKLLQKSNSNQFNKTYVTSDCSFLSFLDRENYKEEIKSNAKKALIASLSLIPTIGPLIYRILNTNDDNLKKEYYSNEILFNDYLRYLSNKTGIIIFVDNIQCLPQEITKDFFELIRQLEGNVLLFTSYTLKNEIDITKKLVQDQRLDSESLTLKLSYITIDQFEEICNKNLILQQFFYVKERIKYFYSLVQYGNMREVDEFIFQIKQHGTNNITDIPTLHGIKALDEIKKDIVNLAALFPEGIKLSFIERIVKYNHNCTKMQFQQSISNLCKMKYILIGDNETLKVEHEKISQASRDNLESTDEEERFIELLHSCKKVFSDILYEQIDDSDFVFCINGLLELEKQFNFLEHLGALEKYINILYDKFRYFQICQLYRNLSSRINDKKIILLFTVNSILKILDSFQKTSCFSEGLEITEQLIKYYNVELYKAKFLLQSYKYEKTIKVLANRLDNYESWSIYLNALQHLRMDSLVKEKVINLINNYNEYVDVEYYYIILRNSGHLFEFKQAIKNLEASLNYFEKNNNEFVKSTCLNNIGILYLYRGQDKRNIQIARNYFKQAQKIMSMLKSNEEYQSNINLGVSYFCENNIPLSLEYFENALTIVPKNLTFDIIKLKCNILICKYILNFKNLIDIRKELLNLYSDAEDLPDPWIKLLCMYNLFIVEDKAISKDSEILKTYPGDIYTYGLIVNYQNSKKFMLGISPHWRY